MNTGKLLRRINRHWLDSINSSDYDQLLSAIDKANKARKLKRSRVIHLDKRRNAPA